MTDGYRVAVVGATVFFDQPDPDAGILLARGESIQIHGVTDVAGNHDSSSVHYLSQNLDESHPREVGRGPKKVKPRARGPRSPGRHRSENYQHPNGH